MGSKLAVYVLFQPNGVAGSTYIALEYLRKHGFTILITSNATLSEHDRQKLAALAWTVIERPNFGYDFGAYRDSILYLHDKHVEPDHLLLMNDSTWFPLSLNSTALDHVVAVDAPFYGFIYKSENTEHHKRGVDHMESHFLSFRKPALDSTEFKTFWAHYKMSSSRNQTIQKGEKGISKAMERAGFVSQGMISHKSFLAHLDAKTNTALREILGETMYHRARERNERDQIVDAFADTDEWHAQAMAHFDWCLDCMQYFVSAAFIAVTLPELDLPFVKKTREDRFHLARKYVLDHFANDDRVEIDPIILAEVAQTVENYEPDPVRE
jgi:lipopolysaccharide biosynthesis protein